MDVKFQLQEDPFGTSDFYLHTTFDIPSTFLDTFMRIHGVATCVKVNRYCMLFTVGALFDPKQIMKKVSLKINEYLHA